jgi:hypothetical protein
MQRSALGPVHARPHARPQPMLDEHAFHHEYCHRAYSRVPRLPCPSPARQRQRTFGSREPQPLWPTGRREGLSDRKRNRRTALSAAGQTDLRDRLGDLAINAPLQEALMPARPSASNSCVDIRSVVHHAQQRIASTAQSDLVNSKVCLVFHHAAGRPPFEPALA